MTCQRRWDFAYGGRLAGDALKRKQLAAQLGAGRAWGAAVAAWHAYPVDENSLFVSAQAAAARIAAHQALQRSYEKDALDQIKAGFMVDYAAMSDEMFELGDMLDHYMQTSPKLSNLTRLEGELDIPLPSRTGKRASTVYRFHGFLDGFHIDLGGQQWLVEFKLRTTLTPHYLIEISPQYRYYAWARQQESDSRVVGVLVDERWKQAPKDARIVQSRKKGETHTASHAVDQLSTVDSYLQTCEQFGVEAKPEVIEVMENRDWQQRVPIVFTTSEINEAGLELVSAAQTIRDLDNGRYPVRNATKALCNHCDFLSICAHPQDRLLVDSLYTRYTPKRLKGPRDTSVAGSSSSARSEASMNGSCGKEPETSSPTGADERSSEGVFLAAAGPLSTPVSDGSHGPATNVPPWQDDTPPF